MRIKTSNFLAIGLCLGVATDAVAGLIDFESFGASNSVGTVISNQFETSDGVVFETDPILGDVGGSLEGWRNGFSNDTFLSGQGASNGQYFISDVVGLNNTGNATLRVRYTSPVDALSFDLIDIDGGETYTINVFDAANVLLSTQSLTAGDPGTGNGIATRVGFTVDNISRLEVLGSRTQSGGFGLAFDNFNTTVDTTNPVPVPATLMLLGLGAVLLAGVQRRRHTV